MSQPFQTPQDAEDAYYDALDERSVDHMMQVWDDSPDIACLLPMQPFIHGSAVRDMWRALLQSDMPIDIHVRHVRWVEIDDIAIHYVEEQSRLASAQGTPPPVYAVNVFRRRGDAGWGMILHQNSPSPPPPGSAPPRV